MATVTTKSKRKSRKRKYEEMIRETKQIRKMSENTDHHKNDEKETESDHDCGDSNEDNPQLSQLSQCSTASQISIPSPSKHDASLDLDDVECDGLLLKSQKANLDELTYLIRGIQLKYASNENQETDDNTLKKLKALIQLGLWLKQDCNQLLLRGSKYIPLMLHHLRILSRSYAHEESITCVIIAILFILTQDNMTHFTDVSINILLRFIRNKHVINNIIYSLRRYHSSSLPSNSCNIASRRSSRRNRNQTKKNEKHKTKIADNVYHLFEHNVALCDLSVGYVASYLLVKIVTFAHATSNKYAFAQQIMDYMSHSAVLYKLALVAQIDCTVLEAQRKIHDIYLNELILLELVTRNYKKAKDVDSATKQTETEALLKILDCIGIGLRFTSRKYRMNQETDDVSDVEMIQDNENQEDIETIERFLVLILKVLTNITNGRNVSLKPDTLKSIFYLLSYYDDIIDDIESLALEKEQHTKNYQLICLILGCFINCCERNKKFRISFNENRVQNMNAIDFLLKLLCKTRKLINEIEAKKEEENEDEIEDEKDQILYKVYTEYKLISFYVSLLIGFLLQSTQNFKYIASKMNELSLILLCLKQFLEFQLKRNSNTTHTVTIITKIIQIVQIRNETLKSQQTTEK